MKSSLDKVVVMLSLADQVVLVTGSSRGLGLAIARAFHNHGARVVLNYKNNQAAADKAATQLNAIALKADVTELDQVTSLFAAAERHYEAPISVVVNNALADFKFNGDARPKLDSIQWADFDAHLKVSLQGALNTTKAALLGFKKSGGGRIINIGSNLVQNPVVPYQDYTAAKGALHAFTHTTAAELGPKGVTVNMVSGGLLSLTDASSATPREVFDQIAAATPLRRIMTPDDLTGAVLFFASQWAAGVTGQTLVVDGGLVMT